MPLTLSPIVTKMVFIRLLNMFQVTNVKKVGPSVPTTSCAMQRAPFVTVILTVLMAQMNSRVKVSLLNKRSLY